MRTAVIADVHANEEAFKAVLRRIDQERVDSIVCLGDIVDYGPRPMECLQHIWERNIPTLMGNHDAAVIEQTDWQKFHPENHRALAWTQSALDAEARHYLRTRPKRLDLPWAVGFHGSPYEPLWHYVLEAPSAALALRLVDAPAVLVGHTHRAGAFCLEGAGRVRMIPARPQDRSHDAVGQRRVQLDASTRCVINPGSVGQPRDNDPRAGFAVVDHQQQGMVTAITWLRVPYDWHATREQILLAGLPPAYGERLLLGQ